MFSALKIPQAYLAMGDGASEDKTTLAQKDIRFSRTIQRLQRVIIAELTKIGIIHLYTLGFRGDDLLNFSLSLNNPSKIAELQEIEHWKQKFDIAASATEGFFSRRWVTEHIFGMGNEDFMRNQREMYYDRKHDAALQAVAEQAAAGGAELGGALGGDLGGDLGADLGAEPGGPAEIEPTDLAPEAPGEAPAGDEGGGDESPLLAVPPGSRDAPRIHGGPNSKGKKIYYPKRDDRRSGGGPRSRSMKAAGGAQKASSGARNTLPGSEINTLANPIGANVGIYEQDESIYTIRERTEESRLFEIDSNLRVLLEGLATNKETLLEQKNEN